MTHLVLPNGFSGSWTHDAIDWSARVPKRPETRLNIRDDARRAGRRNVRGLQFDDGGGQLAFSAMASFYLSFFQGSPPSRTIFSALRPIT